MSDSTNQPKDVAVLRTASVIGLSIFGSGGALGQPTQPFAIDKAITYYGEDRTHHGSFMSRFGNLL
jgi:hypothetical protein